MCYNLSTYSFPPMNLNDWMDLVHEFSDHTDYESMAKHLGVDYETYYESMLGLNGDVTDDELTFTNKQSG